ncbi:hypothetical protein B0H17DRAFT_1134472 [Mycena rosella]|uniref:Uncharacterized protein n=1 Tax=Mycena rosella TaxID=1033263 RepID=A0AAD7GI64_MYCRO|nr:hypothetical protein B0H17DRAFT_1134472 [Mycena rosella]
MLDTDLRHFLRIVPCSNDKLQLAELLSQLHAYTLFELALANEKCGRKILRYVKDTLVDEGPTRSSIHKDLPRSLSRIRGADPSRHICGLRSLMPDLRRDPPPITSYSNNSTDWHSDLVREFLRLAGGFTDNGLVDAAGSLFSIHTMWRGEYRIPVIGCRSHRVAGIVLNLGFCDANGVRHPYIELLNEGVLITTPRHLVIDPNLPSHVKTWRMMCRTLERAFVWNYAYRKSHTCGVALSCPATLRKTSDAAWVNLSLPWSSLGKGLAVPKFIPTSPDEEWTLPINAVDHAEGIYGEAALGNNIGHQRHSTHISATAQGSG